MNAISNLSNLNYTLVSGASAVRQVQLQLALGRGQGARVPSVSAVSPAQTGKLSKADQEFLTDYSTHMTDMQTSAAALEKAKGEDKADAAARLVDRYNKALAFLSKNEDRGIGVLRQEKRMLRPAVPEESMKLVGITVGKDAALSLDADVLAGALEKDSKLAGSILDSFARGAAMDARLGAAESSQNLLGTVSLQGGSTTGGIAAPAASYDRQALRMLYSYSRQGILQNMNLLSGGALMNLNV